MKLVYMEVDNTDSDCMGNEPVYRNGEVVGVTTSGAYGHAINKSLAFAYVEPRLAVPGTHLEVLIFNERRAARLIAEPAWDQGNARPKS